MIGLGSYLAFVGVSLLVICTPGQDTALTIRNTLAGGRKAGVATALGVAVGQATWTIATSAGLALVIAASEPVFNAIRLAGAAYLIYLGIRTIVLRGQSAPSQTTSSRAFAQGLTSNLSNAKMAAFFISLLPPFAGPHPTFTVLLALGLNFAFFTLLWLAAYSFAVERMGDWLRRTRVRKTLDAILGTVLVALGVRVGLETVRV